MVQIKEGTLLWEPNQQWIQQANLKPYMNWLHEHKQLNFNDYHSLWKWSTSDIEDFWESIWQYFNIQAKRPYEAVLTTRKMPDAKWFPEATLNYTEHIFKDAGWNDIAIIYASETKETTEVTWGQLYQDTIAMQQTFHQLGLKEGDRVAAYLPNIYEAVVVFLATASVGAIWSSAPPEFGKQSVIERFQQIQPKIMITVDGYTYGGKPFDRTQVIQDIQAALPSLEATIAIPYLNKQVDKNMFKNGILWEEVLKEKSAEQLTYHHVPFNAPLWILFSSGTTGKPKPIVHSQGGILLEHFKANTFHMDLKKGDRFFWYTTTGWMMWNFLVGALLTKSTIILYDGNPTYPKPDFLWEFAEKTKMTIFGTSAGFLMNCMKNEIHPKEKYDLQALKCISSTGSPLPPEGFVWCYEHIKKDLWLASISGGTDVCTAFILGSPTLPVYAGELQCRGLGAKIESFSDENEPKTDAIGELVITEPMPCMPIYFWNDPDSVRLLDSYFTQCPGVWSHGDYLKITNRHTCVIYGRSDATINRGGVRIGTSEIYRAVDLIPEIKDSLIVDLPTKNGGSFVPLFVVMQEGAKLTIDMKEKIKNTIRTEYSSRHVPSEIYEVKEIPMTLNGKKLEIPVKKILMGASVEKAVNKGSLANPHSLEFFVELSVKGNI